MFVILNFYNICNILIFNLYYVIINFTKSFLYFILIITEVYRL